MSRRDRQRRRNRNRHGHGAGRIVFLGFGVVIATLAIGVLGVVGWVASVANSAPSIDELKPVNPGSSSVVYAADGTRLGFIQSDILRTQVRYADIPRTMKDATIAIEDKRFWDHKGVDFEGILRSGFKNVTTGKTVQGGSTLTMQLVRNLYTDDRARDGIEGYKRKIREAKLAEELEDEHSKDWILSKYLNNIPYGTIGGQEALGVQAAARVFFDKPAAELTLGESALLAGLPQAPSLYNPFLDAKAAMKRRNEVLDAMAGEGMITPAQAARAKARGLGVERSDFYTERREQFFFDFVRSELIEKYGVNEVRKGGLTIHTTLDLDMQKKARSAMTGVLNQPGDPSSAIVTIDQSNGYIKAMASTASYKQTKFNLAAQGHRQPGSTFKIMVLMTALRRGVDPAGTTYVSKPLKFTDPKWGPIDVATYSNTYLGSSNLVRATLASDNSVYQQLDLDLGPDQVKRTAKDMGITSKLEGYPAEGLGGLKYGVSPLEMANAYATIADGGYRNRPIAVTKVVFPDGRTDNLGKPRRKKVFSDGVTYEATKILQQNIQGGTGTAANIGCPAGGKTGTTDNFRDAWFVGFTPKLTTAVWVGYPNTQVEMFSVHGIAVAGGTFPAQIWGAYMKQVKGRFCGDFEQPQEPFESQPFFGKYATTGAPGSSADGAFSSSGAQSFETGGTKPDASGTTGGGNTGYDPGAYETPPQKAPATQAPDPTPAPAPTPTPDPAPTPAPAPAPTPTPDAGGAAPTP
ncbi:transglycosylase domain-containing protein [Capillimicrobium parvum]|uniref:Penicillin-binding protein 1F n=1 Tax=Capillimicrobium parvum TaxID=2884022 RepID=A0A9E7C367_9ACTN|nr:transglycosylase domain-containing protein [Capillimicrobium parvum]UGS39271.1 Penicillin-binding protein 1F [Capillimicrobium parvum]